jgi:hypothetical protein
MRYRRNGAPDKAGAPSEVFRPPPCEGREESGDDRKPEDLTAALNGA